MGRKLRVFAVLAILSAACFAQDLYDPKFAMFGGAAVTSPQPGTIRSVHAGASFEAAPPAKRGQFPWGFLLEGGYTTKSDSGIFSANYLGQFQVHFKTLDALPFFTIGYTRLVGTGNAMNYGGGVDFLIGHGYVVRVEFRDYFQSWKEHDAAVRIGWVLYASG